MEKNRLITHEMLVTMDYIQQWEEERGVTDVASRGQHCLVF